MARLPIESRVACLIVDLVSLMFLIAAGYVLYRGRHIESIAYAALSCACTLRGLRAFQEGKAP